MPRYMDFEYSRIDSGIKIDKYTGSATSVNIPAQIDGLPVTFIGNSAFRGCYSLTNVNIPNSVTRIDDQTFHSCSSLTSITIPNSVTSIGEGAFADCSSLINITIPNSIIYLGKSESPLKSNGAVFSGCKSLKSIDIPNSISKIFACTFANCNSLKNIDIPDSIIYIGTLAFTDCTSLTSIIIPDSVTEFSTVKILGSPFYGCSHLRDIYWPERLKHTPSVISAVKEVREQSNCRVHYYNIPTIFFKKINQLRELTGISTEYLAWIEKLKSFIESEKYNRDMKKFIVKIFDNIEVVHKIQQELIKKDSSETCPDEFIQNIAHLKDLPNITPELSALIKQLEILVSKDYETELNNSVAKILADIWAVHRKEIEKSPKVNLITLVNTISGKKITKAFSYVQKFYDDVAETNSKIKTNIEALASEKIAIQNHRHAPKRELENRIKTDMETLMTGKISVQTQQTTSATNNEFKYTLSQNKGIRIDKYIGNATSVVIPEQIENLPVTVIGYRAFDNPDLKKVVIPESVKSIVYCAFVSQQPMHVLFKGYNIQMIPQSFLAPQITFYCARSSLVFSLRGIINNNPKCHVSYNAADFYKA